MPLQLHFLEAEGSLAPWRQAIARQISSVEAHINALNIGLNKQPVDIVVEYLPHATIPHLGMAGSCYRAGLVTLTLDPTNPNFATSLANTAFQETVAHELHHALRHRQCSYGETLGEALVSEGLADRFAIELLGSGIPTWCQALDNEQLRLAYRKATAMLDQDYDHSAWFFGCGDLPEWTGYTLAYRLIRAYQRQHAQQLAGHLVASPAQQILQEAWPMLLHDN